MGYVIIKSSWDHFVFDIVNLVSEGVVLEVCSCRKESDAIIIAKLLNIFDEQINEELGKKKRG